MKRSSKIALLSFLSCVLFSPDTMRQRFLGNNPPSLKRATSSLNAKFSNCNRPNPLPYSPLISAFSSSVRLCQKLSLASLLLRAPEQTCLTVATQLQQNNLVAPTKPRPTVPCIHTTLAMDRNGFSRLNRLESRTTQAESLAQWEIKPTFE